MYDTQELEESMSSNPPVAGLTARDLEYFIRVIEASLLVTTRSQYFLWAQGALQSLLPHRLLVCIFRGPSNDLRVEKFADYTVPSAHLDELSCRQSGLIVRMVDAWRRGDGQPSVISPGTNGALYAAFGDDLARYELDNAALHCTLDVKGEPHSEFLLARIPEPLGARYAYLLQLLTPYMHGALMRTQLVERHAPASARTTLSVLTEREAEILQWVQHGKSNSEICSSVCVNFVQVCASLVIILINQQVTVFQLRQILQLQIF